MLKQVENFGLHVIHNPAGSFNFVGSIPLELGKRVKPTASDIMALRTFNDNNGNAYAIKFPSFKTKIEAVNHAESFGYAVKC